MSDQKETWWIWRDVQQRLSKWAMALLQGRRVTIRLEPEGTGYYAPIAKVIQANPQLFPDQPVEAQFRVTQGLLAHECGHAWFTGSWPDQDENVLQELTNILEDERIERSICVLYPGVKPAIRLLGDLVYTEIKPVEDFKFQAYTCCLAWRWAHTRTSEEEMFRKIKVEREGKDLWAKIRPLVEQSWESLDTQSVIALARDILKMLDIPASKKPMGLKGVNSSGIPAAGASPLPLPKRAADSTPGLGVELSDEDLPPIPSSGKGRSIDPQPYISLEEKVTPAATRLAEALKEPQQDQRSSAHAYRGRYNFRQEIRTPETPNLVRQEVGVAKRSLALYVLVDRSGSMDRYEEAVKESLMTIYLAATKVGIPIGMAFFGEDDFYSCSMPLHPDRIEVDRVVAEITPITDKPDETPKSLIAGYTGWASNEYLDWGFRKAEEALKARPERLRVVLVVHDGEPVYRYRSAVSDWDLSLNHLRSMERVGIIPIGVHLGNENLEKLHKLFSRLVNCQNGNALPEKLGSLLSCLA